MIPTWLTPSVGSCIAVDRLMRRRSFCARAPQRLPDSPSVHYHLGMAAQQLGDTASARQALTKAVSSPANFTGKDEARKALAQLK